MVADSDPGTKVVGIPWTSETARAAGQRSAEERRRRRLEKLELADLLPLLEELGDARQDLREVAFAGAYVLALRLAGGKVGDRHVHYVAAAVEKLVNVGRLESGEATSHSLSVSAGADDFKRWLDAQRGEVTRTPTAPETAAPPTTN